VARLIGKAKKRSRDLMWVCRKDTGLRPRSAMTLWKAMVRPIMEYAAELWAGEVPKEQMDEMERVQTDFAKTMLGLTRGGISNDFVRAEAGLETIAARCEKLRLGYWRRIQLRGQPRESTEYYSQTPDGACAMGSGQARGVELDENDEETAKGERDGGSLV